MEGRQEFIRDSWRLHPMLEVPDAFPPAVMFSIRNINPNSQYDEALKRFSKQGASEQMCGLAWDPTFREIPGDKIGLLYRNEGCQRRCSRCDGPHGYDQMFIFGSSV